MPSRKKAKGKARKAAKEAKEAEDKDKESRALAMADQQQNESIEALLHRIVIDDVARQKCEHGLIQLSPGEEKICKDFIAEFIAAFLTREDIAGGFVAAIEATQEKYENMYGFKLETVVSILLSNGTQFILDGDNDQAWLYAAQLYASIACNFEDFVAVAAGRSRDIARWTKVVELLRADDHTLVQYYRKRIPCSCLDEKYKEVKSMKKMGMCCNSNCNLPDRMVERRKMFSCTGCRVSNYCSVACQRADWKRHKEVCTILVEKKAAFNSNQT